MLPIEDLNAAKGRERLDARFNAMRDAFAAESKWASAAAQVVRDVRDRGDDAVVEQMRRFTDPGFSADRIRVSDDELAAAKSSLTGELREAIEAAIHNVERYQRHLLPADPDRIELDGAELGLRWTPMPSAGLLAPGGSAVLFSSVIMLAVPALAAGVPANKLAVVSPPPTRKQGQPAGDISPITLAVCRMLGIGRVYRVGGPAAVAGLAFGTQTIEPVSFLAGPGHPVTQAAKLQVQGVVGIDGFYGASEVTVVADDTADVQRVAADLIAQAEHDPGKCFLVCWDANVLEAIRDAVSRQLPDRQRREAIEASLSEQSLAVLCRDEDEAATVADRFACEHVTLAVRDPEAWLGRLQHGGEFFLGDATPVAAGDYYAGPSHCLPTGTTARFSSGVSVFTFLKRSGVVRYRDAMPDHAIRRIAAMARAEGLDGHAASVEQRRDR
ncbi:MAG: histidinol dehydrogenase [Phycisphaeraceae bacterium]